MLELTIKPRTDGYVELCVVVPSGLVHDVEMAIHEAAEANIPVDEVLGETAPGELLRGARGLMGLTQAQLGERIGVHKSNISEMERGLRPIGKGMAKRLARALSTHYKIFL